MTTSAKSYYIVRSPPGHEDYFWDSERNKLGRRVKAPTKNMDYSKFRQSGELSDITVVVNGKEFRLHRFPLYVRSDYFASLARQGSSEDSGSNRLEIVEFPGGEQTFDLVANYCYNMKIDIDRNNVCQLRCAAEFLNMKDSGNLADNADRVLNDLLTSAKLNRNIDMIIDFVLKSKELGSISEQAGVVEKCLHGLVDCLLVTSSRFSRRPIIGDSGRNTRNKEEDENEYVRLAEFPPLWFKELFTTARDKSVKASTLAKLIQSYTKCVTGTQKGNKKADNENNNIPETKATGKDEPIKVVQAEELVNETPVKEENKKKDDDSSSSSEDEADNDPTKNITVSEDATEKVDKDAKPRSEVGAQNPEEKRQEEGNKEGNSDDEEDENSEYDDDEIKAIFDTVLVEIPADSSAFADAVAPLWVVDTLTVAEKVDSVSKEVLRRLASRILHRLTPHELSEVECDLLAALIEASIKDGQNTASAYIVVDNYLDELSCRDELTVPMFRRMVNTLPKEQRKSHDTLFLVLERLLKSENLKVTEDEKEEMLEYIDFRKLSEATLQRAHESGLVPASYITKAAIALCTKLRNELESAKNVIRCQELELEKYGSSGRGTSWLKKYDNHGPSYSGLSYSTNRYAPLSSSAKYAVNSSPALMSEWEMRLAMDSIERQTYPKDSTTDPLLPGDSTNSSTGYTAPGYYPSDNTWEYGLESHREGDSYRRANHLPYTSSSTSYSGRTSFRPYNK